MTPSDFSCVLCFFGGGEGLSNDDVFMVSSEMS